MVFLYNSGYGGDCTNFVNQAIIAGFVGSSNPTNVYNKSKYYDIDRRTSAPYQWYFRNKNSRSYSWTGANELFNYVKNNTNHNYNGLHLDFRTKDNKIKPLDFRKIKVGDIIFADWNGNGYIQHSMIVTSKTSNNYCGIKVTYENDDSHNPRKNRRLCDINKINTIFHVYRPKFYNEGGW